MNVAGYDLPLVRHPQARLPIYPHQAIMVDQWRQHDNFLLTSKTGSGKTAAWGLSYLAHRHMPGEQNVVCVYPTNELIRDQERSIHDLVVNKQGLTCHCRTPEDVTYIAADVELVRLDATLLERYRKRFGLKTKGGTLLQLLQADRPKIVLMNPDTLYLLFTMRYSQSGETLSALQAYQTLVFDEFHLYTGIELAHALFMVHLARELHMFKRIALLSATPHEQVRVHIDRLLAPYFIDVLTSTEYPVTGSRRVSHDIQFVAQRTSSRSDGGIVVQIRDRLIDFKHELEKLRANYQADTDYVPAVVILNSVIDAIDLEDCLRGAGFAAEEIVPMRGLMARDARQLQPNQLVIIGTSAVEVGIDFRTDYLLFECSDAASFRQRLGRLGRHAAGKALFFGDDRECLALSRLDANISRNDFDEQIMRVFPQADARAWFVGTKLGAFTVMAQAFGILRRVEADRHGDFAEKDTIRDWLRATLDRYADRMDMTKEMGFARGLYKNHRAGKAEWIGDYEQIDQFRTSLPGVEVVDQAEQRRGRALNTYQADLKTLLARARILRYENRKVVIDGYERFRPVFTNKNFRELQNEEGALLSTRDFTDSLKIKRKTLDGSLDAGVSYLMSSAHEPHVFVFVPCDMVEDDLDWRMATFPAGEYHPYYLVAFDGDALLLKEIYRRAKAIRKASSAG